MKANNGKMMVKSINSKISKELKDRTVLITGGAGSIGSKLTSKILEYPVKSVRVLDIDEYALFKLKRSVNDSRLRLLLGSILDKERLEMACNDVDVIIHTAAIKNIEISEFNPIETIETNINGTVNLIKLILKLKPEKFLNISTDKAVEPSTLYGTTKQLSERLTSWAGMHNDITKCASARLGNVFETRGNVFEIWNEELKNKKPLSLTDSNMKRYYFHVSEAVDFILKCLITMKYGEVYVPKMRSYNIRELATKISNSHKEIGLRRGEKLQEALISEYEMKLAVERDDMWIIRR